MAINLVTQFLPYVDELFSTESKKSLLTNQDFSWTGAHTVKVYKIGTSEMTDYKRNPEPGFTASRYGQIKDLDATTEEFTLTKDRSFTFAIDKLDTDETAQQLEAASALARQQRQVVIPEVDAYVYSVMCAKAGTKPEAAALDETNIFTEILKASNALDNAEAPETERALVVSPDTYTLMKRCKDVIMETDMYETLMEIMEPRIREREQRAAQESAKETAEKLIKKGKLTLEDIADCTGLPLETVKKLEQDALQFV